MYDKNQDPPACEETYGSDCTRRNVYLRTLGNSVQSSEIIQIRGGRTKRTSWSTTYIINSVEQFFKSAFLPQGYPESVSKDYLQYQIWDSVQAFVSRLMGTLSTQAVLQVMGVGDELATPLAATITWLLRDGTSMVGRILFAWKQGTSLDYNSKQWRLFADAVNDVAFSFDLLAAHASILNIPILCVAGVCRAMVDAAGGATRTAFVQHQARRDNLADVSAKDGSQETLVNLAGLLVSLLLMPAISGNIQLTWLLYLTFTSLHLFSNYKAVRSLTMESINQLRLAILVRRYVEQPNYPYTVKKVNQLEPLIPALSFGRIHLGCKFQDCFNQLGSLDVMERLFANKKYILSVNVKSADVYIVLHRDSSSRDQLESSFQAHLILSHLQDQAKKNSTRSSEQLRSYYEQGMSASASLLLWSKHQTESTFSHFLESLERQGWACDHTLLGYDEWRSSWNV